MLDTRQNFENALETAMAQYAETMGEVFPVTPILEVIGDTDFWADATLDGGAFKIRVSKGVFDRIAALWNKAFSDEGFSASFGPESGANAQRMSHISLVWLMLHEMHHFQMGHFGGQATASSLQKEISTELKLVTRTTKNASSNPNYSAKTNLILEMQADHDASEMLLDACSPDEWVSIRARVAAISAVVMLIERTDMSNGTHVSTHPKAATRIFQLLGHVMDMPLIEAHRQFSSPKRDTRQLNALPETEEQERFVAQVIIPTFFDAVSLAKYAEVQSIQNELGRATDFFQDVQMAKLDHKAGPEKFFTAGAKQWSELARHRDNAFS